MKRRILGIVLSIIPSFFIFSQVALASWSRVYVSSRYSSHSLNMMSYHRMRMDLKSTVQNIERTHIQTTFQPVNDSGVNGIVDLISLSNKGGTHITVLGFGLQPDNQYVSLYYDNHTCQLEPYSLDDVIGKIYTANSGGVGTTQANQSDNLDQINSVSIRNAGDFKLLACADIHPL